MFVVDANVLIYATNEDAQRHEAARRWLDEALNGATTVGLSWASLLAFLRITTRSGILPRPLTVDDACDVVDVWLEAPTSVVIEPTVRHATVLRSLLVSSGTGGNLTSDAHLAALAIEHRATVCSFDRDFERFPGVRCIVPE